MNEGIHLDLDTWIVPGQIRKANLCGAECHNCEHPQLSILIMIYY